MTQIRVAAVQAGSKLFDPETTLERFAQGLRDAKAAGADLAVFPEAFLGGYPKGVDFGARVGSRSAEGRALFQRYYETSFDPDGEWFETACDLVAEAGVYVVTGLIEPDGGTLYCSMATIDPDGEAINWHRKLMPTAMERIIWGFGDGSPTGVVETPMGRISQAICWENYMPLFRAHLYEQKTQLYCVSTVDDRPVWLPSMQMIALEGRCFVISACQFMTRGDVAADTEYSAIQGDAPGTVLINGGSCIVSPLGDVLAAPVFGEPAIVAADIDLGEITRGKFDLDVAGHYGRPDVFHLYVDEGG